VPFSHFQDSLYSIVFGNIFLILKKSEFGHCDVRFVCDLEFVICKSVGNGKGARPEMHLQKNLPAKEEEKE
jgi:hypothetical protein